ncbi:MAG: enoyl-CoA hydratase/isomerase family protein [Acidimicrobiales bacterium]
MPEGLEIERRGSTLVATVERGEENSFSGEMIDALADAIDGASSEPGCRFVRLRARGSVFCVARDRVGTTPDQLRAEAGRIVRINETLRTSPMVTIAEVNGDAAGFGCGLVAASDIAIASEQARFWFPEIRTGLPPTVVIGWASKLLPAKRAFDMVVTGDPIGAATAAQVGLITQAVPTDAVSSRVDERIAAMEALHPEGVRDIKRFFAQVRTLDAPSAARSSVDALVVGSLRLLRS